MALSADRFKKLIDLTKNGQSQWRLIAIRRGMLSPQQRREIDEQVLKNVLANECIEDLEKASFEFQRPTNWIGKHKYD